MISSTLGRLARTPAGSVAYDWLDLSFEISRRLGRQNAAYDAQTAKVIERVVKPGGVCIDVGAHKGEILKEIVKRAPDEPHIAFEPLPYFAEMLREKFPGLRHFEACATDETGKSAFNFVENDPGYSGLKRRVYDRPDPIVTELEVDLLRIDDVVDPDRRVSFLKIDVEGAELSVLRGAEETIRRDRPLVIFEAGRKSSGVYGVTAGDFFDFFEGAGMGLYTPLRWLAGKRPFRRAEYTASWSRDYYFVAYA